LTQRNSAGTWSAMLADADSRHHVPHDEPSEKAAAVDFVPVECPACGAAHWLNWRSGRLLGEDDEE